MSQRTPSPLEAIIMVASITQGALGEIAVALRTGKKASVPQLDKLIEAAERLKWLAETLADAVIEDGSEVEGLLPPPE